MVWKQREQNTNPCSNEQPKSSPHAAVVDRDGRRTLLAVAAARGEESSGIGTRRTRGRGRRSRRRKWNLTVKPTRFRGRY